MNFDSRDLRLLQALREGGSLTTAAQRLHVSQPAASQRLARLTEQVGVTLFERRAGSMRATAAGEVLAEAARTALQCMTAAGDTARTIASGDARALRIGVQCYTTYRWLPFVLSRFNAVPGMPPVDVVPEATPDPYEALRRDTVDIVLSNSPVPGGEFLVTRLFDDEMVAVLSAEHDFAARRFLSAANLATQTLVVYTSERHAVIEDVLKPAALQPSALVQVGITEAIVELARAGKGVGILSGWAYADLHERDGLRAVRITRGGYSRPWWSAVRRGDRRPELESLRCTIQSVGKTLRGERWRAALRSADGV